MDIFDSERDEADGGFLPDPGGYEDTDPDFLDEEAKEAGCNMVEVMLMGGETEIENGTADRDDRDDGDDEHRRLAEAIKSVAEEFDMKPDEVEREIELTVKKLDEIKQRFGGRAANPEDIVRDALRAEVEKRDEAAKKSIVDFFVSGIMSYVMTHGKPREIEDMVGERAVFMAIGEFVDRILSDTDSTQEDKNAAAAEFFRENFGDAPVTDISSASINELMRCFAQERDFFKGYIEYLDGVYADFYASEEKVFEKVKDAIASPVKLDTVFRL